MTRDDVIRMAREAGIPIERAQFPQSRDLVGPHGLSNLESFAHVAISDFLKRTGRYLTNDASREAALEQARAEEREACAKVCDEIAADRWNIYKGRSPYSGREEGRASPHVQGENSGAEMCANAIRARGQK